jgi:predicted RNA polymerase sigma factor
VGLPEEHARRTVESVARESYGRLIAFLSARTRDVASAEDALSDALVAALATWPRDGVPGNPQGWLMQAARNRLIDRARHVQVHAQSTPTLELLADAQGEEFDDRVIPDERLRLMFVCAHPAIDADIHTPLMLQTVLGLDAARIARAFLIAPQTMGQRLVRAKTKIRKARIEFAVPTERELPGRLDAVLQAIYAAYGTAWDDALETDTTEGLAAEAIWLARALCALMPHEPEAHGLLALMLHCEARRPARRGASGEFVPLSAQDSSLWLKPLIAEAERELTIAAGQGRIGRMQIEAAIQSAHAERAYTGLTDWNAINALYYRLVELSPAVGARVGYAAAHAEVAGAAAGLALLDAIDAEAVKEYQAYWAVRAHLLKELQNESAAAAALQHALGLTQDEAVRRFLMDRHRR